MGPDRFVASQDNQDGACAFPSPGCLGMGNGSFGKAVRGLGETRHDRLGREKIVVSGTDWSVRRQPNRLSLTGSLVASQTDATPLFSLSNLPINSIYINARRFHDVFNDLSTKSAVPACICQSLVTPLFFRFYGVCWPRLFYALRSLSIA